ncbi:hypothetical protein OGAPHI_006162 [Ogataea philodendri]|uniref:Uncharacterized protein n=1 Tax=Ogataea philodendri TaxID=1378263 RepID=A0A9P8T0P5_9ASCO|nr:uncharacterized protein OGAPHI_006162 [Ogataea philodendri]KAH3661983.1 hypothetical protein OGAPHI_006162 [Ogataea philodendri]
MDEEPPIASQTPIESFYRPLLRRSSTNNYKSELEAHTHRQNDLPEQQLQRRQSEELSFERMRSQVHRHQLLHNDDDSASVISSPSYETISGQRTSLSQPDPQVSESKPRKSDQFFESRPVPGVGRRLSFKYDDYKKQMLNKSMESKRSA